MFDIYAKSMHRKNGVYALLTCKWSSTVPSFGDTVHNLSTIEYLKVPPSTCLVFLGSSVTCSKNFHCKPMSEIVRIFAVNPKSGKNYVYLRSNCDEKHLVLPRVNSSRIQRVVNDAFAWLIQTQLHLTILALSLKYCQSSTQPNG